MLTKPASATLTPYQLLAAKIRDWTPPHGLTLKSYDARSSILGIMFKVVLTCQCEAEERLSVGFMVSHDIWEDSAVCRDVIVDEALARAYEEADQKLTEHAGART